MEYEVEHCPGRYVYRGVLIVISFNQTLGMRRGELDLRGDRRVIRKLGESFPWSKLAFGYALATDDDTPVVNINAGSVRMHGLRVYTYTPPEDGSELPLVGDDCIVFIEIDRVSSENDITLSAQTVMTPTTATTLRIPLYTFRKLEGGSYALHVIHNMGDINIDQPIR